MKYRYSRKALSERWGLSDREREELLAKSDKEKEEFTYKCVICGKEHKESERPCVPNKVGHLYYGGGEVNLVDKFNEIINYLNKIK